MSFCQKYAKAIPNHVVLQLRTGEEIDVKFKRSPGKFSGMSIMFFRHIDCKKGVILVFQYNGGNNFWVHVINKQSRTEIYSGALSFLIG